MSIDGLLPAAVIFDMDGVLADTEPMHTEAYVSIWNEMGLDVTPADYHRRVTMGHMTVSQVYESLGGDMSKWQSVMDAKHARVRDLLANGCQLLPGVLSLLQSLRSARVPTAVATLAGRKSADILMAHFDLAGYFDRIVTWEDVANPKPAPDVYLKAAEILGVDPAWCVALEDSPRGVLAATRAGMKCIAIPAPSTASGDFSRATLVVRSMEEVTLDVLSSLL